MIYKLINKSTGEEHLCNKVTIDGFDYYVSDDKIMHGDKWYDKEEDEIWDNSGSHTNFHVVNLQPERFKKIIATNNPSINIAKVVDEVQILATEFATKSINPLNPTGTITCLLSKNGFEKGYNKSQEMHPFSEEDMIGFNEFSIGLLHKKVNGVKYYDYDAKWITTKELLQIWKEQRVKTIYYESN